MAVRLNVAARLIEDYLNDFPDGEHADRLHGMKADLDAMSCDAIAEKKADDPKKKIDFEKSLLLNALKMTAAVEDRDVYEAFLRREKLGVGTEPLDCGPLAGRRSMA